MTKPMYKTTDDPRKAETLEEACDNGDGTYNGIRMLSWLSEALRPGRGMPYDDVKREVGKVLLAHGRKPLD